MPTEDRRKLLDEIMSDQTEVRVCDVARTLGGTLQLLERKTNSFGDVIDKIGEDAYVRMMHSLLNSFLSTLYVNAPNNEAVRMERLAAVQSANSDLMAGIKDIDPGAQA